MNRPEKRVLANLLAAMAVEALDEINPPDFGLLTACGGNLAAAKEIGRAFHNSEIGRSRNTYAPLDPLSGIPTASLLRWFSERLYQEADE